MRFLAGGDIQENKIMNSVFDRIGVRHRQNFQETPPGQNGMSLSPGEAGQEIEISTREVAG